MTEATEAAGATAAAASNGLRFGTASARWVLLATVGASGMAFLDSTVVGVALPHIGRDFDTDMSGLQWVVNGYLLTTSALILLGGSLGDLFGRRKVFMVGVAIFAVASLVCGVAPTTATLVLARVLQGVGGALLTPGSLAILEASFHPNDRSRAIGAWSGLSGVASAIGPFLGGWLVDAASWRWVFLLNLPLAVVVIVVARQHVPESCDQTSERHIDVSGAALIGAALAAMSWGLIGAGENGWTDPTVAISLVAGAFALAGFVTVERRGAHPMVPPSIFASAQFRAVNLVTVAVYGGLGCVFFLLVMQLQQVLDYTALQAGAASLPVTLLMLTLSSRSGHLADRIGPRLQMSVGPLIVAAGMALLSQVGANDGYVGGVLPGIIVVGFGLAATVAPLTAVALAAVDDRHAGVASGVNTTVARAAQLTAVAAVPLVAGITGDTYLDPVAFSDGFSTGMLIAAVMVALGGVVGWALVRNPQPAEVEAAGDRTVAPVGRYQCGVEAVPLDRCPDADIAPAEAPAA